jgi:hypothetical protein
VTFSASFIEGQALSDFSIRETLADQLRHLFLPFGQRWGSGSAQRRKSKEIPDLADEHIDVTDVGEVRSPGKFDQTRALNERRDQRALFQRGGPILPSVEHERWSCDLPEAIDDVHVVTGSK